MKMTIAGLSDAFRGGGFWICLAAICLLLIFSRRIAWWLFSFDREVEKILSRQKSSEVRLGKIAENLSPLVEGFPVDIKKPGTSTVFIGQPIDFIHFDPEDGITFIEVKSGGADLSGTQRALKKLVQDGRVSWRDFRVK